MEVTFQEEGQHTRVTLTHGPVGEGSDWQEAEKGLNAHWPEMLENLASVLETGIDLRFARRPRLGILIDDFTPEAAKALGVPVNVGVLLNGTAEGTGARAAGLQKGDVLVELNGVALTAYDAFNEALKGLKAGDKPEVVFYRGAEKQTIPLELSSLQILEVPAAGAELAAKVRRLNGEIKTALIGQLEGLSEEQSAVRP